MRLRKNRSKSGNTRKNSKSRRKRSKPQRRRPAFGRRPRIEQLEDRQMLAVDVTPVLIDGLDHETLGSESTAGVALGDEYFFTADDGIHGSELWKTDGTHAGTQMVRDITPGSRGGKIVNSQITASGGLLYFSAVDESSGNGKELWRSDGTAVGTKLVKDITPGPAGTDIKTTTDLNGILLFVTTQGELWRSNGTELGTQQIANFASGNNGVELVTMGPKTYFFATEAGGDLGELDLWVTDGTSAGTTKVVDSSILGSGFSDVLTASGSRLFFASGSGTKELWTSDGTAGGTETLFTSASRINELTPNGTGGIYFAGNDGVHGGELWFSDGTSAGTSMVMDLETGSLWSSPSRILLNDGNVYFFASVGSEGGIWVTDGTPSGAQLLAPSGSVQQTVIEAAGDSLFFAALNSDSVQEIWSTDGTPSGTSVVHTPTGNYSNQTTSLLGSLGDDMLFVGTDVAAGAELWKSDGTLPGTNRVRDINKVEVGTSLSNVTSVDGVTLAIGDDGFTGQELWVLGDGLGNSAPLLDINPGDGDGVRGRVGFSNPNDLFNSVSLGKALFHAKDSDAGSHELWVTDGTVAGTEPLGSGIRGSEFIEFNGLVYFSGEDQVSTGHELWVTDGTPSGTSRVKDINVGAGSSAPRELYVHNSELYFSADDGISGRELWKSDGTEAGTVMVHDINDIRSTSPAQLTSFGNDLYFFGALDLWKTDGTSAGTELVFDFGSGTISEDGGRMIVFNNNLYFAANDTIHGDELWISDGTTAGTGMLLDLDDTEASSLWVESANGPASLFAPVQTDTQFFFHANIIGDTGLELWTSDGTASGTHIVLDVVPGEEGWLESDGESIVEDYDASLQYLVNLDDTVYFPAPVAGGPLQLWSTDGTGANTAPVAGLEIDGQQLTLNGVGNAPLGLSKLNNGDLFLDATHPALGHQLWQLVQENLVTVDATDESSVVYSEILAYEDGGDLVVDGEEANQTVTELFRQPLGSFTGIVIDGSASTQTFDIDIDGLSPLNLPDGFTLNAGEDGANDNDLLLLRGSQTVTNYQYTTGGPESGTIEMDGLTIAFTQFEPILDQLDVTNRTFTIGTEGSQTIELMNDVQVGFSTLDDGTSGTFESLTFSSPTNSLEISAGDGDDTIVVEQLDPTFSAVLKILAEEGDDSIDASAYSLPVILAVGAGSDSLLGGTADDSIDGGEGDDVIDGGAGIDDVDGGTGNDQIVVGVGDNVVVSEGSARNLVLTATGATEGDTATIDWGDGSAIDSTTVAGGLITAQHVYYEDAIYTALVTIGAQVTEVEIQVDNEPQHLVISGPTNIEDGVPYMLGLSATDPGDDTLTGWVVHWGDGTSESVAASETSVSHIFPTGAATYVISATATDEDGTYASNSIEVAANVNEAPIATLDGSSGAEQDDHDQHFSWVVSDADGNLDSVDINVTKDGLPVTSLSGLVSASGSVDFNSLGVGDFEITLTATDTEGEVAVASRSASIVDDDTDAPIITLGGSSGTELGIDTNEFTWDVTDASGLSALSVIVTRDAGDGPEILYSTTDVGDAAGSFNFDDQGVGVFEIIVVATDADGDWAGDGAGSSAGRTTVVGEIFISTATRAKLEVDEGEWVRLHRSDMTSVASGEVLFDHSQLSHPWFSWWRPNLDAFHMLEDGSMILSTSGSGQLNDEDFRNGGLVRFYGDEWLERNADNPGSLHQTAEMVATEVQIFGDNHWGTNIDAISIAPDGDLVISIAQGRDLADGHSYHSGDLIKIKLYENGDLAESSLYLEPIPILNKRQCTRVQ